MQSKSDSILLANEAVAFGPKENSSELSLCNQSLTLYCRQTRQSPKVKEKKTPRF